MTTATTRSKARYARAARVLPPVPLGDSDAAALAVLMSVRETSATALVRELIRDAFARIKATPRARSG